MADLDERLNRLVTDQDSMKKVVETAKAILAQRNGPDPGSAESSEKQSAPPPTNAADAPESGSAASLTALLQQLAAQKRSAPPGSPQESSAPNASGAAIPALAAALPQFMTALSGQGNLLKSERVDLINAMRPYLKEERAGSIDRALKMANVAKAAMSAMHLLGR
ncbi:MAG: hypothetical protein IJT76_05015 [Clostridia bacterium]|nr:hypothetical protein [Clostridia bacterium]